MEAPNNLSDDTTRSRYNQRSFNEAYVPYWEFGLVLTKTFFLRGYMVGIGHESKFFGQRPVSGLLCETFE